MSRALKPGDGSISGAASASASRSSCTISRQRSQRAACSSKLAFSSPSSTSRAASAARCSNSSVWSSTGVGGINPGSESLQHLWQGLSCDEAARDDDHERAGDWQKSRDQAVAGQVQVLEGVSGVHQKKPKADEDRRQARAEGNDQQQAEQHGPGGGP